MSVEERNTVGNVVVVRVYQLKTRRSRIALASRAGDLWLPCLRMVCPELAYALPRLFLPKLVYDKRGLNLVNLHYLRKVDDRGVTSAPFRNNSVRVVLVNARSLTNNSFILNEIKWFRFFIHCGNMDECSGFNSYWGSNSNYVRFFFFKLTQKLWLGGGLPTFLN